MKDMDMVHGFRCTSALGAALLLLLIIIISASRVSAVREEMPMQQLSRSELVRMAGYGEERLSSVLVTGTLSCEACVEPGSRLLASHVSGAKVAVACKAEGKRRRTNWAHGTTDEYGEFIVDLPSQLHAIPRLEEACVVRVLSLPENSICQQRLSVKSRRMKLSSVGNGIRVYTTGIVRLSQKRRPSNDRYQCSQGRERN